MNLQDVQIRAIRKGDSWTLEVTMRNGKKRETFTGNQSRWTDTTYASFDAALESGIICARFEASRDTGRSIDQRHFQAQFPKRTLPANPDAWNTDGDVRSESMTGGAR